jgi:FtsH-binding integral membrane protein
VQLLFTTLAVYYAYINEPVQVFLLTNFWVAILVLILLIVVMIVLLCCRSCARTVPQNYILLAVFTACESYFVAFSCSVAFHFYKNGGINFNI